MSFLDFGEIRRAITYFNEALDAAKEIQDMVHTYFQKLIKIPFQTNPRICNVLYIYFYCF